MSARVILATCAAPMVMALLSCSGGSPTAGGGSDMPNGMAVVCGTVTYEEDSSAAAAAEVLVRQVVITAGGDSLLAEYATVTSAGGEFSLDVRPGRYAVLARSPDRRLAALEQFFEVDTISGTSHVCLALAPTVDLAGFVSLPPGFYYSKVRVSIPGLGIGVPLDLNRSYLLQDVPPGYYDIAFTYQDIVNYLRVRVLPARVYDSVVQMRNVEFAVMGVMGMSPPEHHARTMRYAYAVTPIYYRPGQEPAWYGLVRLDRVVYYGWEGDNPVAWDPARDPGNRGYDALLSGVVYRNAASGRVVMETMENSVLELRGDPVSQIGTQPVFVTVAVIVRSDGSRVWYEVVDMYPYPLF